MDITELKIKDILSLQQLFSLQKENNPHPYIDKYVIIRSSPSGVHFGIFKNYDENTNQMILKDSRRIHKWQNAFTLSAIANNGLGNTKNDTRLSESVPEMSIGYVCEIIPCSEIAIENLKNYRVHTI